jgi:prephenate dehydratase
MIAEKIQSEYDAAFQGARGAYSEAAARQLLPPETRMLPSDTLEDVFRAVTTRRARVAVVPLENTIAGTVPGVYDLLLEHELRVIAETRLEIDHALIGTETMELEDVRRVLSHPVALGQCRAFLQRHPRMAAVAAFDTAGAVELIMRENDGSTAAIAGAHAAKAYGAKVLAEHLQDHEENFTRFVLLARADDVPGESNATRVLVVFSLRHRPGALMAALRPIADREVNLTKIESRPIPTRPFEYRFIVELEHGGDGAALAAAVADMRQATTSLRILGEYATQPSGGGMS